MDAKIAAAEARTDTKFAELRGDLKDFLKRSDFDNATRVTRANIWGAALTLLGIVLAALAFGGGRFDAGMGARSMVESVVSQQHARDDAQDRKLDEILRRLPPKK